MSFATGLFFYQLVLSPLVFGVLYLGWTGLVPPLSGMAAQAIGVFSGVLPLERVSTPGDEVGLVFLIASCYTLALSLPLSFFLGAKRQPNLRSPSVNCGVSSGS